MADPLETHRGPWPWLGHHPLKTAGPHPHPPGSCAAPKSVPLHGGLRCRDWISTEKRRLADPLETHRGPWPWLGHHPLKTAGPHPHPPGSCAAPKSVPLHGGLRCRDWISTEKRRLADPLETHRGPWPWLGHHPLKTAGPHPHPPGSCAAPKSVPLHGGLRCRDWISTEKRRLADPLETHRGPWPWLGHHPLKTAGPHPHPPGSCAAPKSVPLHGGLRCRDWISTEKRRLADPLETHRGPWPWLGHHPLKTAGPHPHPPGSCAAPKSVPLHGGLRCRDWISTEKRRLADPLETHRGPWPWLGHHPLKTAGPHPHPPGSCAAPKSVPLHGGLRCRDWISTEKRRLADPLETHRGPWPWLGHHPLKTAGPHPHPPGSCAAPKSVPLHGGLRCRDWISTEKRRLADPLETHRGPWPWLGHHPLKTAGPHPHPPGSCAAPKSVPLHGGLRCRDWISTEKRRLADPLETHRGPWPWLGHHPLKTAGPHPHPPGSCAAPKSVPLHGGLRCRDWISTEKRRLADPLETHRGPWPWLGHHPLKTAGPHPHPPGSCAAPKSVPLHGGLRCRDWISTEKRRLADPLETHRGPWPWLGHHPLKTAGPHPHPPGSCAAPKSVPLHGGLRCRDWISTEKRRLADPLETHRGPWPWLGHHPLKTAGPHPQAPGSCAAPKSVPLHGGLRCRDWISTEKRRLADPLETHRGPWPWVGHHPLKTAGPHPQPPGSCAASTHFPLKNEGWPIHSKLTGDLGHG